MKKNQVALGGQDFVVSYVLSKLGFADHLAMTYLLEEGTSVFSCNPAENIYTCCSYIRSGRSGDVCFW